MRFYLLIACLLTFIFPAFAFEKGPTDFELVPGQYRIGSQIAYAGINIHIENGWHIYWKNPGEGGLPPTFKVISSQNLRNLDVLWPAPKFFRTGDFISLGYDVDTVLPLKLNVIDPEKPVFIDMDVGLYGCSTECQPFKKRVSVMVSPRNSAEDVVELKSWLLNVPQRVSSFEIESVFDAKSHELVLGTYALALGKPENLIVDAGPDFIITQKNDAFDGRNVTFDVRGVKSGESILHLPTQIHLLFKKDELWRAVTVDVKKETSLSWSILVIAFFGGLILNGMPCVLPVLAIKLSGFTKSGSQRRRGFVWSGLGIVISFIFLAFFILLMQSLGRFAGWGIQFQNPYFLALMSILMIVFAISFFDRFSFRLPYGISDIMYNLGNGTSAQASFFQGMVATLLATPCSAPFVGTAVGFALATDGMNTVLIFLGMGLGMAAPYFLLAIIPASASYVPRSGSWMNYLKIALGFGMIASSAILLVFVMSFSLVAFYVIAVAEAILLLFLIIPIRFACIVSAFFVVTLFIANFMLNTDHGFKHWQQFDPGRIQIEVGRGKTVVVEFSASWCITCKVNDKTTFSASQVIQRLERSDVVAMKGDWTKPDATIEEFLKRHGRFGIPFTAVFSRNHPDGLILPEVLTPHILIDAIGS